MQLPFCPFYSYPLPLLLASFLSCSFFIICFICISPLSPSFFPYSPRLLLTIQEQGYKPPTSSFFILSFPSPSFVFLAFRFRVSSSDPPLFHLTPYLRFKAKWCKENIGSFLPLIHFRSFPSSLPCFSSFTSFPLLFLFASSFKDRTSISLQVSAYHPSSFPLFLYFVYCNFFYYSPFLKLSGPNPPDGDKHLSPPPSYTPFLSSFVSPFPPSFLCQPCT